MSKIPPDHLRAALVYASQFPEGKPFKLIQWMAFGPNGWLAPLRKNGMQPQAILRAAVAAGYLERRGNQEDRCFLTPAGRAYLGRR